MGKPTKEEDALIKDSSFKKLVDLYIKKQKKIGPKRLVTQKDMAEEGVTRHFLETHGGIGAIKKAAIEKEPNIIVDDLKGDKARSFVRSDVLEWYIGLRNKLKRTPSKSDIRQDGGVTLHIINNNFGSISRLEKESRETFPDKFNDVSLKGIRTGLRLSNYRSLLKQYKKFCVTSAITGCGTNLVFLKNLKEFCKRDNRLLLILICSDPSKPTDADNNELIDKELLNECIVLEDTKLNSNLFISTIKLSAKQINPTTGLERIGKKKGSFIYASPKMYLKYTSVRNEKTKLPHFICTTGCISLPEYNSRKYMSQRTSYIADHDHQYGAVCIDIESTNIFHFSQIESKGKDYPVYFRGVKYVHEKYPEVVRAEGLVLGDIHSGVTCMNARKVWTEAISAVKPKRIFIHDGFNGISVNAWIENDIISRAFRAAKNLDCLRSEIICFAEELRYWASKCNELVIVPSNHNDWLERWLKKAKYTDDPKNHYIGVCLAKAMLEGHHALKFAVEEIGGLKLSNIVWMERNDDLFIDGVQMNAHGDMGVNGSKGSLRAMDSAYPASISGHSHTAGIIREAWQVGTSGPLQEEYNNGPGTWTQTSCIIYSGGCRSLINSIGGKWKI